MGQQLLGHISKQSIPLSIVLTMYLRSVRGGLDVGLCSTSTATLICIVALLPAELIAVQAGGFIVLISDSSVAGTDLWRCGPERGYA